VTARNPEPVTLTDIFTGFLTGCAFVAFGRLLLVVQTWVLS